MSKALPVGITYPSDTCNQPAQPQAVSDMSPGFDTPETGQTTIARGTGRPIEFSYNGLQASPYRLIPDILPEIFMGTGQGFVHVNMYIVRGPRRFSLGGLDV
jgi:hypothetical protein